MIETGTFRVGPNEAMSEAEVRKLVGQRPKFGAGEGEIIDAWLEGDWVVVRIETPRRPPGPGLPDRCFTRHPGEF